MARMSTCEHERLTFGCQGCIARAEQARIDNAPERWCTWHVKYSIGDGIDRTLSFTKSVRVPDGWTWVQVDEHYAGLTGEAFVMALPDDVPIEGTDRAMFSMEVDRVVIGELVHPPAKIEQEPML